MDHIFKLDGILNFVMLNNDPTFTKKKLQGSIRLQDIHLNMINVYHAKIYGKIEVGNLLILIFLGRQHPWARWIPMFE